MSHTVDKCDNIYPGIDPTTNKLAPETPENFINKFERLIRYARSNNIEVHLNDITNRHILPKRELNEKLNHLETDATKLFYLNLQNSKMQLKPEKMYAAT